MIRNVLAALFVSGLLIGCGDSPKPAAPAKDAKDPAKEKAGEKGKDAKDAKPK